MIEGSSELYYSTQDSVNIRELPTMHSNAVGRLGQNDVVRIIARSKRLEKIEIGGETVEGVWCRTTEGTWVFSHFLSLYPVDGSQ